MDTLIFYLWKWFAICKKIVVGVYEQESDIPEDAEDIKELLLSIDEEKEYSADYSNGVDFTVVDIYGYTHWFNIKPLRIKKS